MDLFDDVLALLKNESLSIAAFAVILAALLWQRWYRYNKRIFLPDTNNQAADTEQRRLNDLAARKRWIEEQHFETLYLDLLGRLLDGVAARFTRDGERLAQNRPVGGWMKTLFGVQPFTENSYLLCLRLAFIYPWLAFFLVWIAGGSGSFSGLNLLPTEASPAERSLVGLGLIFGGWFIIWRGAKDNSWRYAILGWIAVLYFTLTYVSDPSFAPIFAIAIAILIVIATTYVSAFASDPAPALALAYSFAAPISIAIFFVSASVSAFASDSDSAIFVAAVIACAFNTLFASGRKYCATPRAVCGYWIVYNAVYLILSIAGLVLLTGTTISEWQVPTLLLIFLVTLPLINAFMDWLSLGVTRGFLYAIHQRTHHGLTALLFVAFDIILALAFLLAIIALTVLVLAGADAAALDWGGAILIDLNVLLDGLAKDPLALEYGWVHFMMLTTLIPTLIHFAVAGASAILVFPNRWRESILRQWDERGDAQTTALWYVTLVPAIGLLAPVLALYGLYLLLSAHGAVVGLLLLDWARMLSTVFT